MSIFQKIGPCEVCGREDSLVVIGPYAKENAELRAENAKLLERCYPSQVVIFDNAGHYVSEAVGAEIARLRAEVERMRSVVEAAKTFHKIMAVGHTPKAEFSAWSALDDELRAYYEATK